MHRPLRTDVSAMELLEWALETASDEDRPGAIAGAPVPLATRRMALDLLRLENRSCQALGDGPKPPER